MSPSLEDGEIVVFSSLKSPKPNSVVLSKKANIDFVKRLYETADGFSLRGDNIHDSYDIEDVSIKNIQASMIYPQK